MKYYKVKAKCGHVGRHNYLLKDLFIYASSSKEAAMVARKMPRVKHHHKDAIRNVQEISFEEYQQGMLEHELDNYFNVHNRQDQLIYCNLDEDIERELEIVKPRKNRNRQNILSAFIAKEWNRRRSYFYE